MTSPDLEVTRIGGPPLPRGGLPPIDLRSGLHATSSARVGPAQAMSPVLAAVLAARGASCPEASLRHRLLQLLRNADAVLCAGGFDAGTRRAASYCVCTWADEQLLRCQDQGVAVPAGWSDQSLLALCHHERVGGERVFVLMEAWLRDARRHSPLLELARLLLALGFEGRHALEPRGAQALRVWRRRLDDALRDPWADSGAPALSLVLREGVPQDAPALVPLSARGLVAPVTGVRPRWIAGLASAWMLVSLLVAALWLQSVRRETTDLGLRIDHWRWSATGVPVLPADWRPAWIVGAPDWRVQLQGRLAADLRAGLLSWHTDADGVILDAVALSAFASGSDRLPPGAAPVLTRLARAVRDLPVHVELLGGTDPVPLSPGGRFASLPELGLARAQAVAGVLRPQLAAADGADVPALSMSAARRGGDGGPSGAANLRRVRIRLADAARVRPDTESSR